MRPVFRSGLIHFVNPFTESPQMDAISKAIESLSSRGQGWRETGDREVTESVVLALNELKLLRAQMAITSGIRTSLDFQHLSKDGFPGYPAE